MGQFVHNTASARSTQNNQHRHTSTTQVAHGVDAAQLPNATEDISLYRIRGCSISYY
jgi:hypothetical protein